MLQLSEQDSKRLIRYHGQSLRFLRAAVDQIRQGRWMRCEELLWGSLSFAVKGVALSHGNDLVDQQAIKEYAENLGNQTRDRRIRNAFTKLAGFSDTIEKIRESHMSGDRLVAMLEDISGAVERLWELLPVSETGDNPLDDTLEDWLERYRGLTDGDEIDR